MVVSERVQFLSLGIGMGMLLAAIYPAIETEAEAKPQRDSIWESVETGAGSETAPKERREVIQSNATQRDLNPKSLPLDPQQVEPDLPAAIAVVPSSPAVFSMSGTRYDLKSFIDSHYRRPWTYPGGIDAHLAEHGVDTSSIQGLSHTEKERLHAAIHERELNTGATVKKSLQVQTYSNCPGGVCPAPTYTTRRRGLFGLRR